MTGLPRPRLEVFADLAVEVDGSPVSVSAAGSEVRIDLSEPAAVLGAVSGVPLLPVGVSRGDARRGLARFAEAAAGQGIAVTVSGPDGVLLTVGTGAVPSRLTRLATGTELVALGRWSAVRGPLVTVLRHRVTTALHGLRARVRR